MDCGLRKNILVFFSFLEGGGKGGVKDSPRP